MVSIPLLMGFVFPVMQMVAWAAKSADYILEYEFLSIAGHTLWLSASTALILLVSSTILSFFIYQFRRSRLSKWSFAVNLGYAIPAAIIGIGILVPIALLNKTYDVLVTGTSGILILAYCFRYQAISFNGIDGAFRKLPISQHEAALTLGKSRTGSLFSILIPQVKRALLGATLLVFVDITKELPLTMLFQRFNQETLAVKAFIMMDTDGAFYKASIPSLLIVLLGVLAVILFRILDKSDK